MDRLSPSPSNGYTKWFICSGNNTNFPTTGCTKLVPENLNLSISSIDVSDQS